MCKKCTLFGLSIMLVAACSADIVVDTDSEATPEKLTSSSTEVVVEKKATKKTSSKKNDDDTVADHQITSEEILPPLTLDDMPAFDDTSL